jgi:hypothetical protein
LQALPEHIVHGYNYPNTGIAMFSSRSMDEAIIGQYFIQSGDLSRLVVSMKQEGMENLCEAMCIVTGSLLLIRVDKMQEYIGVSIHKIDDSR